MRCNMICNMICNTKGLTFWEKGQCCTGVFQECIEPGGEKGNKIPRVFEENSQRIILVLSSIFRVSNCFKHSNQYCIKVKHFLSLFSQCCPHLSAMATLGLFQEEWHRICCSKRNSTGLESIRHRHPGAVLYTVLPLSPDSQAGVCFLSILSWFSLFSMYKQPSPSR